tara:strand:+ start:796 stop:2112 length:1317 start_codon:yes stop_codon:yes gene_type:complete
MKILFIENRDKTYFFDAIAKKLLNEHSISWIVQNNQFKPKHGDIFKIKYPKKTDLKTSNNKNILDISKTDRIINHFSGNNLHYDYYFKEISKRIRSIKPDIVFGESTQFHELISIKICKKYNIPYLNPSSTSYPKNRFFFYMYDKKNPFKINNSINNINFAEVIDSINNRTMIPDYMSLNNKNTLLDNATYRLSQILEYFHGEKYTTPSLFEKISIDLKLKRYLRKWDKLSMPINMLPKNKKIMLYPLQMQPEANIDVWGNNFRDQSRLINDISNKLPNNWILVVKTNPKSKYEMNENLFKSLNNSNVFAINRDIPMHKILKKVGVITTVTGTIAIEGFLGNIYTFCLAPSIIDKFPGSSRVRNLKELKILLKLYEDNKLSYAKQSDKVEFMKFVFKNSFLGNISDPRSDKNCLNEKNIDNLYIAFSKIISRIKHEEI